MKLKLALKFAATWLALSTFDSALSTALAQATAFTYQGSLSEGGSPASGTYDLRFILRSAGTGGSQVGATLTSSAVIVDGGLFTTSLDFGAAVFAGADRWLEIAVRTNGGGVFVTLNPRQPVSPTPYALRALNLATNGLAAGIYASAVTFNNAANSLSGNGAGLTALNASQLTSGTVPDARLGANVARTNQVWLRTGNAGTTPGTHFLGTTDNQPLEIKVNGERALRIEPATHISYGFSPNILGGYSGNIISNGFVGAAIVGGGSANQPNRAGNDFATVVGGRGNTASGLYSTAMGSSTTASGIASTAMGFDTTASGQYSTAMGGFTVASGLASTAMGTFTVASGERSTAMGESSVASGFASTAMGAFTVASGERSTAMGQSSVASGFASTAMGLSAKAKHPGSFVWADAAGSSFDSVAANTFNIRASGGVWLSSDTPALSFGSDARQMINLFGTTYGIGVQSGTTYFRSASRFSWFRDGTHSDTQNDPGAGGVVAMTLTSGGLAVNGVVVSSSDRNVKAGFTTVDPQAILARVAALPIHRWHFTNDVGTPHLGPVAQDFRAAFGLGTDDKHIATVDADGVALAAIQGLNQKVDSEGAKLREELKRRDAENAELKARLTNLEKLITNLSPKGN